MATRGNGGIIGPLNTPNGSYASGVWTLDEQRQSELRNTWPSSYAISRSLRFNAADTTYLARTPSTASNRRTYTWSGWVKKSNDPSDRRLFEAGTSNADVFWFGFGPVGSTDQFLLQDYNGSYQIQLASTAVFRDPLAWYHVVVAVDTTQATSTDRVKIYINAVQITSFASGNSLFPSQNYDTRTNQTVAHDIGGSFIIGGSAYFNGYMTEVNFIDGQALTPSSFGEINADTGVWEPKPYAGTYGTNGFYLNFRDNSNTTATTLGLDTSGNGNNWTPNNFSVAAGVGNDSVVDVPTRYGVDTGVGGEVRGNYCTLNPLINTLGYATLSNGNLDVVPNATNYPMVPATFGMTSGKWYWEYTLGASGNAGRMLGIVTSAASTINFVGSDANGWGYYGFVALKFNNNTGTAYGSTYTNGDVIGVAFDADAGTLVFYKNGTSQGTAFSSLTSGPYFPAWSAGDNAQTGTTSLNFGQRPFAYTAPSGFKALNTQNLPTPTIGATPSTQAGKFFNPVLWTGNASGTRTISGVGFQPDFVWAKARSAAYSHLLYDVIRGGGNDKELISNGTGAEGSSNTEQYGFLSAFTSDGFTAADGTEGTLLNFYFNQSGETYVAWNWKANGAGVTNTAGTITSTVSANTTSGFSVVTYTGNGNTPSTVGHGLGAAPKMVIVKSRSSALSWVVGHASAGFDKYLLLDTTDAAALAGSVWNNTPPASTVFTIGNAGGTNTSGATYVAYCFAEVPGYSKFGSYTGNGSADGPFCFTGMRPAFVMLKNTTTGGNSWHILDVARGTYNVQGPELRPNETAAESVFTVGDFVSNGFKLRDTNQAWNKSGDVYIFAAFAEAPQKFALAR